MFTALYLKERKPENLVATVELEVVPRGIYQVGNKVYKYVDQPKFVISEPHGNAMATLLRVELIVEESNE